MIAVAIDSPTGLSTTGEPSIGPSPFPSLMGGGWPWPGPQPTTAESLPGHNTGAIRDAWFADSLISSAVSARQFVKVASKVSASKPCGLIRAMAHFGLPEGSVNNERPDRVEDHRLPRLAECRRGECSLGQVGGWAANETRRNRRTGKTTYSRILCDGGIPGGRATQPYSRCSAQRSRSYSGQRLVRVDGKGTRCNSRASYPRVI